MMEMLALQMMLVTMEIVQGLQLFAVMEILVQQIPVTLIMGVHLFLTIILVMMEMLAPQMMFVTMEAVAVS